MHMHCLFIVLADDKYDAISQVENFLWYYYEHEFDYYVLWWRWDNIIPWNTAPLSGCIETVKEYSVFHKENTIEAFDLMMKKLEEHKKAPEEFKDSVLNTAWYYAIKWWRLVCDYFCNTCLLYDIEWWWADHIPEDHTWYYVVSVDMHN